MKFGKHLQKRQLDIPEYAACFVNYKALKKLIKQLSATPTLLAQNVSHAPPGILDAQASLQANKATFFFRLERELEKVNACYLQKEAELELRLQTLLDKKRVMQSRNVTASKVSANFISLEEGFRQFNNDLDKLQQYIEVNGTAFAKILKKWDKTSKSKTKELFISCAVEVQPCFNQEVISNLSDQATTSRLELEAWAEGEKINLDAGIPTGHVVPGQSTGVEETEADTRLLQATVTGNLILIRECIARLESMPDAGGRLTRAFLAAVSEAPDEALDCLLASGPVDLHAEDEISERNCLHEAAISGRDSILATGLSHGVDPSAIDVYGRIPLHYACMHGRVTMVNALLDSNPRTIDSLDHDNFTPLIHGITRHQLRCVEQLLRYGARIDPVGDADHVPLNLACQYGAKEIAQLLLEKGASILSDAEGLFPQHLVARSGQVPDVLLLLQKHGADLDQRDSLYQWTPLFHAASAGRVNGLKVLLDNGVDANMLDEKGLSAMYYASWEGNLECMKLLSSAGGDKSSLRPRSMGQNLAPLRASKGAPESMPGHADGIPDLSLPPPIIPLRRYGHNFLDTKAFVQISFRASGRDGAVRFHHDSKYPAARLTISSESSELVPRSVMLPIQEDPLTVSFQVDSPESFSIDFDIFPSFGSKVIARTVALPGTFSAVPGSSGHCRLPLFDPRLRAIGQISFDFQVIKPFPGMPLEIAQFETYWKAASQLDSYPNTLITGSSLSGRYVQLFVQLTGGDGVPVLYPRWSLQQGQGFEYPVSRMSARHFLAQHARPSKLALLASLRRPEAANDIVDLHRRLNSSFLSLADVLAHLPADVHVNLHVLYPSAADEGALGPCPLRNVNDFADAILTDVFDHARAMRDGKQDSMRSVVFTSHSADMCTALNWKQPNYPVLLCNDLGADDAEAEAEAGAYKACDGHAAMSVKEAVRIAQSNNLMGLVCTSRLLGTVPSLIESIKVAGLVLVSDTSADRGSTMGYGIMPEGIDGAVEGNGVLRFNETIDV